MESEVLLPLSQQLATCPYPNTDKSSPGSPSYFFEIYFNIILPSTHMSSKKFLSLS
jgi:hypothetical protein